MKYFTWIVAVLVIVSCKKSKDQSPQLSGGTWKLISETRTGTYDNSRYVGLPSDNIQYTTDGKVYSTIQGQSGLVYDYQLDASTRSIMFQFVSTHPTFMVSHPCVQPNPGCLRRAQIVTLTDNLLVLGNTFTSGSGSLTIVDSLRR